MADYVIRKHAGFTFNIEGDEKLYTIPPMNMLCSDDMKLLASMKANPDDMAGNALIAKQFVLRYAPDLENAGIGDMDFVYIFNAYFEQQNKAIGMKTVGES